ncbi:hypothetical protein SODALDRAFT_399644 [Sodiomyces alkalinus F11]|uniref:RING-type domain-containing protein n=1 Tax=Sodiomyces alkalinus (strain CBS 110278 / VKM F-3762 / F11) TaxID=1314773 RepID=A0A3N2PW48_SODAK|nr:hypothetical protein SODALDRAFT_399644 [Sodiomyces alkalinus F11]ROT38714.1 hypothetical protein SODALDRAFT_399644 [Sodiomyces alkalinus F11]
MSLDHRIKCNYLTCRKELTDRAVVTTCSHIYCIECAELLRLVSEPFGSCPACEGSLPAGTSPQATSIVHLNPSDEFKSTVLSGLAPNDIIECAGRALSFWGYQTTQEIAYQRYVEKTLSETCRRLESDLRSTVERANTEIENLQNQDLGRAYKEKSHKLLETQELFDRTKREAELRQIQAAACGDARSHGSHHHGPVFQGTRTGLAPGLFEQQAPQVQQAQQSLAAEPPRFDENMRRGLDATNQRLAHARGLSPRYSINAAVYGRGPVPSRGLGATPGARSANMSSIGVLPKQVHGPSRVQPDSLATRTQVHHHNYASTAAGPTSIRPGYGEEHLPGPSAMAIPHMDAERRILPTSTFGRKATI